MPLGPPSTACLEAEPPVRQGPSLMTAGGGKHLTEGDPVALSFPPPVLAAMTGDEHDGVRLLKRDDDLDEVLGPRTSCTALRFLPSGSLPQRLWAGAP